MIVLGMCVNLIEYHTIQELTVKMFQQKDRTCQISYRRHVK